jgi:23S rRNA (uracil1939-C5)-methyltransferase
MASASPVLAPVRIERIAAGGDGVGRLADGRTVFVPRTAPGDLIELAAVELKKRFARATVGLLLQPGPDRVEPRCPHYVRDRCGGCQLQHLAPEAQRAVRQRIAGDALRRLAKLDVADPPIEPAPDDWHYRTRITLHRDGDRVGLRPLDQAARAFELEHCFITSTALMDAWRVVRACRDLLPPDWNRLVLRLDRDGHRHLVLEVEGRTAWSDAPRLARALAAEGAPASLWLRAGSAPVHVAGPDSGLAAAAFEQVHPAVAWMARAFALDRLAAGEGDVVWDLYAGLGDTSRALAKSGAAVTSVECDPDAVAWAERHDDDGLAIQRRIARAEREVHSLPDPDLVIANPPRTGMDSEVVAAIARRAPRRLAYISCDPATLARDIARLGESWQLTGWRAFDQFPQTGHVESVALLEPR